MKKELTIPECWDEMTAKQFTYLLRRFFVLIRREDIEAVDIQRDLAYYMLGRKMYVNPARNEDYLMLVSEVAKTLDWIFRTEEGRLVLNYDTTTNILPTIKQYKGPQTAGTDLRFGEFRILTDIMNQYNADHDEETLDALVGTLYRKPNPHTNRADFRGDYRQPFNQYHIERYARNMRRVPEYLKYGAYLWFVNFCRALINDDFMVEGRTLCFAPVFGSSNNNTDERRSDDTLGMLSILFTLADAGTFGNTEQTNNAPLIDVMCKLLSDYNQAKELQRK